VGIVGDDDTKGGLKVCSESGFHGQDILDPVFAWKPHGPLTVSKTRLHGHDRSIDLDVKCLAGENHTPGCHVIQFKEFRKIDLMSLGDLVWRISLLYEVDLSLPRLGSDGSARRDLEDLPNSEQ